MTKSLFPFLALALLPLSCSDAPTFSPGPTLTGGDGGSSDVAAPPADGGDGAAAPPGVLTVWKLGDPELHATLGYGFPEKLDVAPNGDVYLAGEEQVQNGQGQADVTWWVTKLTSAGAPAGAPWPVKVSPKVFSGAVQDLGLVGLERIIAAADGSVTLVGRSPGIEGSGPQGGWPNNVYIAHVAGTGTLAWLKQYALDKASAGYDVAVDADGTATIAGSTTSMQSTNDCLVTRYSAQGTRGGLNDPWTKDVRATGTGTDVCTDVVSDASKNVFVSLWHCDTLLSCGLTLKKYDPSGAEVGTGWNLPIATPGGVPFVQDRGLVRGSQVRGLPDGGLVVMTRSLASVSSATTAFARVGAAGTKAWQSAATPDLGVIAVDEKSGRVAYLWKKQVSGASFWGAPSPVGVRWLDPTSDGLVERGGGELASHTAEAQPRDLASDHAGGFVALWYFQDASHEDWAIARVRPK